MMMAKAGSGTFFSSQHDGILFAALVGSSHCIEHLGFQHNYYIFDNSVYKNRSTATRLSEVYSCIPSRVDVE